MARPGRDRLAGEIEADETYVGGPEEGKRGREVESKGIVAVAAEQRGRGIGRIRLRRVKDVSAESLLAFLKDAVEPGATIHTDGWRGYAGLPAAGYRHQVTVVSGGSEPAHEVMPRVHKVAALLKRWLLGTLQGGIQHQHLDYYLDEFTFRFNRRRSQAAASCFTASSSRRWPWTGSLPLHHQTWHFRQSRRSGGISIKRPKCGRDQVTPAAGCGQHRRRWQLETGWRRPSAWGTDPLDLPGGTRIAHGRLPPLPQPLVRQLFPRLLGLGEMLEALAVRVRDDQEDGRLARKQIEL